jgi:hypothetical protein
MQARTELITPEQARRLLIDCERLRQERAVVWVGPIRQEYTRAQLERIANPPK